MKLKNVNSHYFKNLSVEKIFTCLSSKYKEKNKNSILNIIEFFKSRAESISDIEQGLEYLLEKDLKFPKPTPNG